MKITILKVSILTLVILSLVGIYIYQQKETVSYTAWKTSENWLLVSLPSDWQVKQSDFGGGSVLRITDEDSYIGSILATSSVTVENTAIDFSSWVNQMKDRFVLTGACEETIIDAVVAKCWQNATDKHYFVQTPTLYFMLANLQSVHNSIDFFPADTVAQSAQIIP